MDNQSKCNRRFRENSLTGTLVNSSACQNTGRRRGREKVNTSNPTAYTPVVIAAWKGNCFVCVSMLFIVTIRL